MKFLADENLPQVVINHIASKGYQIVDLKKTSNQGKTDSEICKIAKQNHLSTFMKKIILCVHDR